MIVPSAVDFGDSDSFPTEIQPAASIYGELLLERVPSSFCMSARFQFSRLPLSRSLEQSLYLVYLSRRPSKGLVQMEKKKISFQSTLTRNACRLLVLPSQKFIWHLSQFVFKLKGFKT